MKTTYHIPILVCILLTILSQTQAYAATYNEPIHNRDSIISCPKKFFDFGTPNPFADKNKQPVPKDITAISTRPDTLRYPERLPTRRTAGTVEVNPDIDRTKDVEHIPYQESISPTGARIYTVPITLPSTVKYQHAFALQYNSQTKEGIAGYGWDISGISEITLTDHSIYYHGEDRAARQDDTDPAFSIDGIMLTENENGPLAERYPLISVKDHILVKPNHNGNIISHFDVLYPDGSKAVFGFPSTEDFVISYPIVSSEDKLGNRIEYMWETETDNLYKLDMIEFYNAGDPDHPTGRISFSYTQDPNRDRYKAGIRYYEKYLLTHIAVFNPSAFGILYSYDLTHKYHTGVKLLESIGCTTYGTDLSGFRQLNPLRFSYGTGADEHSTYYAKDKLYLSAGFNHSEDVKFIYRRGKFNPGMYNDGLIVLPEFSTYDRVGYDIWTGDEQFGSTYAANQAILIAPTLSLFSEVLQITAESGFQYIDAADIDNDGVDEIVKVNHSGYNSGYTRSRYKISIYGCIDSEIYLKQAFNIDLNGVYKDGIFYNPRPTGFTLGDFTGEGYMQLCSWTFDKDPSGAQRTSYISLIDLNSGELITEQHLFSLSDKDYDAGTLFCIDMDNDSRTELCHVTPTGMDMYNLDGGIFRKSDTIQSLTTAEIYEKAYHFTDYNSDGYADIAVEPAAGSGTWKFYLFTGTGFTEKQLDLNTNSSNDEYLFFDADKDGRQDIIYKGAGSLEIRFNRDDEYGEHYSAAGYFISSPFSSIVPCNARNFGDVSDFITVDSLTVTLHAYSPDLSKERLLTTLTDSYGKVTDNEYGNLTEYYDAYMIDKERSFDSSEGFSRTSFNLPLLTGSASYLTSARMPSEQLTSIRYTYYDAVENSRGLGFCGFGKVKATDFMGNTNEEPVTIVEYDPELSGTVKSVRKTHRLSQDSWYEIMDYTYTTYREKFGELDPKILMIEQEDTLTRTKSSTTFTYDQYGYQTLCARETRETGNQWQYIDSTYTTYSHKADTNLFLLGSVSTDTRSYINYLPRISAVTPDDPRIVISKSAPVSIHKTFIFDRWNEKEEYTYDALMQPVLKVDYVGESIDSLHIKQKTKWSYDSTGNITSEKTAPYNVTVFRGESYTYDPAGRYLLSSTDKFGKTTTYSRHSKFGKPELVTDYIGKITIEYDEWGNIISTNRQARLKETISKSWSDYGTYRILKSYGVDKPAELTEYDAAGREIRTGVMRQDSVWVFSDKEYGDNGQVRRVSLPHTGQSQTILWNSYDYDEFARPISYTEASSGTTTWSYDGLSTTETRNGTATTRRTNVRGHLVSITDPGGTVSYSMRPDGQPEKISMLNGRATSFKYDVYGNRTEIDDPSAGVQTDTLSYLEDGSSIHEHTNPNGSIVTLSDSLGRVISKRIRGEYDIRYLYSQRYKHQLLAEYAGATSKTYTYDRFDRVATIKETAPDGKWLQKSFSYSDGGAIIAIDYESQSGVIAHENYRYTNGHNSGIRLNGVPVIQTNAVNEFLQPTSVTTGDITRTYTYSQYGMPVRRTMGNLMDVSYQFDPARGNLMSRTDNIHDITETFSYDSMNRLTGAGDRAITYSPGGNITSIDDVGSLSYADESHPYRVTQLELTGNAVPAAPQSITYTCYQRPAQVTESGRSATFTYDADGRRVKMYLSDGADPVLSRYYLGDRYETDVTPEGNTERLYIGGNAYNAPVVYVKDGDSEWTMYNIGRDYLGNITHIATADGTPVAEYSYDPWGRLRNPETHEIFAPGEEPELFLGRGYTGHEHLTDFGLINMNARLYDPVIGRFLSPDPYVQDPESTQGFNRYTYCLNNPLVYIDENGEFVITTAIIIGVCVGAAIGIAAGIYEGYKIAESKEATGWEKAGYMIGGGLIGGIAGGGGALLGAYVGSTIAVGGFIGGAIIGGTAGAFSGFTNGVGISLLNNPHDIGNALKQGILQSGIGGMTGAVAGGLIQGTTSAIQGNNFWNGASPFPSDAINLNIAHSLNEQLALEEAMSTQGTKIINYTNIGDPQWTGWNKMQYIHINPDGSKTNIHYFQHHITGEKAGFKFKY